MLIKNISKRGGGLNFQDWHDYPVGEQLLFRERWDELLTLLGKNHAHIGVSLLFTELGRLRMGYDALDVDVGTYDSWYRAHPPMNFDKGVYLPFAEQVKQVEGVPALAEGDTVITAVGMEANHALFDAIRDD